MSSIGFHEDAADLSDKTKDMHRAISSLMEELEAVDWYNQRVDACKDQEFVHQRERIGNQHVQEEKCAADRQDGSRAEPREHWCQHASDQKSHVP